MSHVGTRLPLARQAGAGAGATGKSSGVDQEIEAWRASALGRSRVTGIRLVRGWHTVPETQRRGSNKFSSSYNITLTIKYKAALPMSSQYSLFLQVRVLGIVRG